MRRILIFALIIMMVLCVSGCGGGMQQYSTEFFGTFDTVVSVIGYAESEEDFLATAQLIQEDFVYLNKLFDIYNDYDGINNIKTINDNAGTPVEVEKPVIELLTEAKQWHEKTDGAMNVAMGPVLSIWHDYREAGIENPDTAELPTLQLLFEAAQHCDIGKVIIDEENSTVFIEEGMSLDVGSIAKGYATQYVAQKLIDTGIDSVLISAGGNVRAIGAPADERTKWGVGIKDPDSTLDYSTNEENLLDAAYIDGLSVVTSGSYERYYTVDGKNYHHIIDESTLMPSEYYKSVTVITQDSTAADALSTALFVMPIDEALFFAGSMNGVEALWVLNNGELMYTDGAPGYLRDLGGASNN